MTRTDYRPEGYGQPVGILSHLLVPRTVRRAVHPVRTVRHAVTPRPIRRASYQLWAARHPARHVGYRAISRRRRR